MRINALKIENYRTLESVSISFPSAYAAICGANDSGKTNVVRSIRRLVKGGTPGGALIAFPEEEILSPLKDDFPKWKDTDPSERAASFELSLSLEKDRDVGFYQFVVKQLSVERTPDILDLGIRVAYAADRPAPTVVVTIAGNEYSDLGAQEVLQKLQSSRSILFHNSTQAESRFIYPGRSVAGHIREIAGQHEPMIAAIKKTVSRGLAKISKSQQAEFEGLLGRLQTKYKVGLSMPAFDFTYLPFSITLGDRTVEVPLDDWGSGTRNRTLVLLALFRARQLADSEPSASKITPVLIIEEPESFLHPSAQAEFGRVLQDLAEEFRVQVLVTTHSPYLLNLREPAANILLRRRMVYRQLRETECVDTSGENWMAPFGQALGLGADEFKPWKAMLLGSANSILLVEGDTDKEYFELLRDAAHGANQLRFDGEIVPYEGTGSLSNTVLLRFVKTRHQRLFVTFDLDAQGQIEKTLHSLSLEKGREYAPIGLNVAGKKNIEGLLPDKVTTAVYAANAGLVQAATAGTIDEQRSAKNRMKRLLLDEFKRQATPGPEYFSHFYAITKIINKALASTL